MKVQLTVFQNGKFICHNDSCRWKLECANHWSASSYRYETGLSSQLKIENMFLGGAEANCFTSDEERIRYRDRWGAMFVSEINGQYIIYNPSGNS